MGSFNDRLGAIAGGEGYPSLRERRAFVDALLAVRAGAGRGAEAQLAPLPLTVAIYDHAALPPPVLERAKRVATEIYGRIGVSLTWLAGPQAAAAVPTNTAACPDSPTPLIHLRLLDGSANPRRPVSDLGFAVAGGTLASVLVERVEYVAKRKSQDVGDLLGVVMSHEIGHLFLPPDSHSTGGIMAPKIDLFLIDHGGPSFNQPQASMIRARIASLSRSGQGPCRADVRQRLDAPGGVALLGTDRARVVRVQAALHSVLALAIADERSGREYRSCTMGPGAQNLRVGCGPQSVAPCATKLRWNVPSLKKFSTRPVRPPTSTEYVVGPS
jgi:hypothetical protein